MFSLPGIAIDGNNNEDKERYIKLVKKRGKVKALDEELQSKYKNTYESFGLFMASATTCVTTCVSFKVPVQWE